MLDRITDAEADVQEKYSTFRAEFDGHAATDNELEDVLRTATDTVACEAGLGGSQTDRPGRRDDLRKLAHLRNEAARPIGFADYWHAQLLLDELDPEQSGADPG